MCEAFDRELRRLVAEIPGVEIISNLARKQITDNLLLDLLAWQFHCDFYNPDMSIEIKRELVVKSLDWHTRKGTVSAVEEIISTVFSKAIIHEWYEYDGLPYRFRISTDEQIPDIATRNKFVQAIKSVKNTRSSLDSIAQLVYFQDKAQINEMHHVTMQTKFTDDFSQAGKIYYNGRVLYDGHTVRSTEFVKLRFNGRTRHGGSAYYKRINKLKALTSIMPPLRHSSGLREQLSIATKFDFNDTVSVTESFSAGMRHHLFYNGRYKHNGTIRHNSNILIEVE
jgi:phage tail P2-like protein